MASCGISYINYIISVKFCSNYRNGIHIVEQPTVLFLAKMKSAKLQRNQGAETGLAMPAPKLTVALNEPIARNRGA